MPELSELERIQTETAKLDLDEAIERNKQRLAQKAQSERLFKERQRGFAAAAANRAKMRDEQCNHRQGGSMSNPMEGNGKSALGVTRMPDGWTKVIKCLVCRGDWATPHPYFMRQDSFPVGFHMPGGAITDRLESKGEIAARLALYKDDMERFAQLLKDSKDKLSDEAKQEMDCGTVHTLTNMQTGVQVYPWRQYDVDFMQRLQLRLQKKAA
jgi:hypothetical protein